jgi:hypothetical protein
MEQLLNNTPIQWVQVTDPSTGRVYYAPDSYIYTFNDNQSFTNLEGISVASASYALTASYALNGGTGGSTDTGSLLTTASFSNPNLEFIKGNGSGFALNLSSLTTATSSYATTASYAANGGVTQIIAGTNILITPTNGLGAVTINSTGGGGGTGANTTASFSNLATWTFIHGLNSQYPIIQVLNTSFEQIIPKSVTLTDANTVTITFPTSESGYAIASLGGLGTYAATASYAIYAVSSSFASTASYTQNAQTASYVLNAISASFATLAQTANTASYVVTAQTASYVLQAVSASFATTASYVLNAVSASFSNTASYVTTAQTASYVLNAVSSSFASTASYVNNLNQALTVGNITSTPATENTLNVYPPFAGGTGEGGQILLAASGGVYSSASMLDTWQDQFRVLRGSNTGGSNAGLMYMNLQTGNTQFVGAVTASAYSGLPNAWLHALRSGNQTIGSGTWANRDIIFNNYSSNNFTYNSSTGIATLKAGKTYRITARLAWAAAGLYVLQFGVYNQTTSGFTGPTAEMIQSPNGTYNISDGTLEHIFNVGASDVDISIRTTSATNALTGEYIRGDLNTQLIIQQIA